MGFPLPGGEGRLGGSRAGAGGLQSTLGGGLPSPARVLRESTSPRWGEVFEVALFGAVSGQKQFAADGFENTIFIRGHVAVPEADDAVAEGFDGRRPRGVGLCRVGVLAAVKFDDQSGSPTGKVGDVRADGELEDEFLTLDLAVAEALPETGFHLRPVAAQFACDGREALFRQYPSPSPHSLPGRERALRSVYA